MSGPNRVPANDPRDGVTRRGFLRRGAVLGGAALGAGLLGVLPAGATPLVPLDPARQARGARRQPRRGGTLTVGLPFDFPTFDPFQLSYQNFMYIQNLYDTLIRYDKQLTALPGLAESWEVGSGGDQVTLKLRQGVKYQSGRELVADDIVKNFEKAADKDRGINMLPAVANVAGVTAPDSSTVVIKFKSLTPIINDVLQSFAIIDPSGMDSLKTKSAGSGPFRFVEWQPNDHTTTERNPEYWGTSGPYLDRVIYKSYGDVDAMIAALQSGQVDLVAQCPPKDVARLSSDFNMLKGYPGTFVFQLRLNPTRPPFDNKLVRQALNYAIDREGVVKTVFFGISEPTALPYSTYSPAYDASTLQTYAYDLKKAKALLDQSGATNLRATAMCTSSAPEQQATAQILKEDLASIGFTLDIEVVDSTEGTRRLLAGDFQMVPSFIGNSQKYPTRITLNSIYRTVNNPVWGDQIPKSYVDAVQAADSTIDKTQQLAAFKRLNDVLMDEAWVISICYNQTVFGLAKHVQGFDYTVDDMLVLENVWLDK